MLDFHHLSVTRGQKTILHQVNGAIPRGKLVALLGENGAGKSTLLHASGGQS